MWLSLRIQLHRHPKTVCNPLDETINRGHPCAYAFTIVQELCESRGGRPGLSVLTSLLVSVDVKLY